MRRWLVTYRLPGTGADRIEVEATGPVAALDAAKRLLPETAELVGYRVIAEAPLPGVRMKRREFITHRVKMRLW
jgi:hypothetical protein